MGLDQYAYVSVSDGSSESSEASRNEIAYWRKHPNLQGWMERIWERKGSPVPEGEENFNGSFNCIPLELDLDDLDELEEDIRDGTMASLDTSGFFFGGPADDYYREQDLEFIRKAREEIESGNRVFYSSWW